jgi:catechol 2,3-dioxygenase-like lactoylglutathione lyase family enzyme
MDWTLEVVVVPVSDVDRAKAFYTEKAGFNVDVDQTFSDAFRVVQLTPLGLVAMPPGSLKGLQLCVTDIEAARAELVARGMDVTPIRHMDNGVWVDGRGGPWNSFIFFDDPDGNSWTVQEKPSSS